MKIDEKTTLIQAKNGRSNYEYTVARLKNSKPIRTNVGDVSIISLFSKLMSA